MASPNAPPPDPSAPPGIRLALLPPAPDPARAALLAALRAFLFSPPSNAAALPAFRYFARREFDTALAGQLVTVLALRDAEGPPECVGYGHLDPDGGHVWLGVAVSPLCHRAGIGRAVVRRLLAEARENGVPRVRLSVDRANAGARALYLSEGFADAEGRETLWIMEREVAGA
ncbi:acyl-CoA N-acyltransferase [Hyaloraphidium curvatum]|nr:acyl-CoA N-acyltransferase [Hyaloraphidium curvatum]